MHSALGISSSSIGTRRIRAVAAIATAIVAAATAACNSDSNENTVPPVATGITVNTGSSGQTGTVGQALATPVSVHVVDQNGAVISGAVVTWTPNAASGSVASATSTTDASGDATVVWTLGNTAGLDSLTASIATGTSVTITATATASAFSGLSVVSGGTQQIGAGATSAALVVKAKDQFGNPVANATVNWSVTGGGTLSAATSTTDSTGTTSVTLATGSTAGTYVVTATAGSATPVTFTITTM